MAGVSSPTAITIVLVHGGFVDGSGWESVFKILKKGGYSAAIVQNPTISLADDVAATRRIVHKQKGPVILVGRSYGGSASCFSADFSEVLSSQSMSQASILLKRWPF